MGAITGYLSKMHEIEDKIDILIEYISVYMYGEILEWGGGRRRMQKGRREMT